MHTQPPNHPLFEGTLPMYPYTKFYVCTLLLSQVMGKSYQIVDDDDIVTSMSRLRRRHVQGHQCLETKAVTLHRRAVG